MERLTHRYTDGEAWASIYKVCACGEYECKGPIIERLAAYEDTGLEPEEIEHIVDAYGRGMTLRTESAERLGLMRDILTKRLKELAQAEKDGRLMVLPVKEGAKIYRVRFNFDGTCYEIIEKDFDLGRFRPEDFGRIIFRPREEAEAALKKREEDNEAD